ncbi:hypothetical protein V7S43_013461 [Phytophthora oleae]|uniref:Uncharacterized protein n=1 Tax=Phytophthora oleae TaxID=2107226 RepID=A0ABD3F4R0_9STRA
MCVRDRAKSRRRKPSSGSSKARSKPPATPQPTGPTRAIRAMQIAESEYGSDSDESGSEGELLRVYGAASSEQQQAATAKEATGSSDPKAPAQTSVDPPPQDR